MITTRKNIKSKTGILKRVAGELQTCILGQSRLVFARGRLIPSVDFVG